MLKLTDTQLIAELQELQKKNLKGGKLGKSQAPRRTRGKAELSIREAGYIVHNVIKLSGTKIPNIEWFKKLWQTPHIPKDATAVDILESAAQLAAAYAQASLEEQETIALSYEKETPEREAALKALLNSREQLISSAILTEMIKALNNLKHGA